MQTPLYYTLVEYEKGDKVGLIFSIFSLFPIFIIVSYVTLILDRFNSNLVFGLVGQLLNEAFNSLLKKSLKVQRPFEKGRGYGMPSAHAQFVGYMIGYFWLFDKRKKLKLYYFGLVIAGILTAYSRVYLEYHTLDQVAVGFVLGMVIGLIFGYLVVKGRKHVRAKKI
jgi:dolichyldiphosphatase